jgi:hypothetical protein
MRWEFEDLDTISGTGRKGFGFRDEELVEFVRLCILHMLEAGGVPIEPRMKDDYGPTFQRTDRFGTTREAITDNMLAEWRARGGAEKPLGWGVYAFAMPDAVP